MEHGDEAKKGMKPSTEIDTDRLAREARGSEHEEAYQPMGKLDGISLGVGARGTSRGETAYFIEFQISICSGLGVDLKRLAWIMEVLGRLEERGYSLTCQDDMSFSCELTTCSEELVGEYERAIMMVARS